MNFVNKSVDDYNDDNWVFLINNSIDSYSSFYADSKTISYNWALTGIQFGYKILNIWVFPSWFPNYTQEEREQYFIDEICKNTSYDISYSTYSGNDFIVNKNILEWTFTRSSSNLKAAKAFILCVKQGLSNYWAYGMYYRLLKDLAISTVWTTAYSYNELYWWWWLNFSYSFFLDWNKISQWSMWFPRSFGYYTQENWTSCSSNSSDYNTSLSYSQITSDDWQTAQYSWSNWNHKLLICFWVIRFGSVEFKEWKIVKFNTDSVLPSITYKTNDWISSQRYWSSPRSVSVECQDNNISSCSANYWWTIFNWTVSSDPSKIIINMVLDKPWINTVLVTAYDDLWNTFSNAKDYKMDASSPSFQVSFSEIVTWEIITWIETIAQCIDWLSWCNNANIPWWVITSPNTYKKTYTSNQTDNISFTDNVWNTASQPIGIFNIWLSLANWFWVPYSSANYAQKPITWQYTTCWSPSSCTRTSPITECVSFNANINPTSSNGYDVFLSWSQLMYKTNHRFVSFPVSEPGFINCQYYDWKRPDFLPLSSADKVKTALDWPLIYYVNNLTETWWSWIKSIEIQYTKENWVVYYNSGIIYNSWQENSYINKTAWITLFSSYKNLSDFDFSGKWYGTLSLTVTIGDWAWNKKTINDYMYIVPWRIVPSNSISIIWNWATKSWIVVGDGNAYYDYLVYPVDQYGNYIRNYNIPWVEDRIINYGDIIFNNTTSFLSSADNPVYYMWPYSSTFGNLSNSFSFSPSNNPANQNAITHIKVKSLVPTNESWFKFSSWINWWSWSINLKQFIISDNKFGDTDLWSVGPNNQKLKYWPALEMKISSVFNTINDNTNYDLKIDVIKNTDKNILIESNKVVDFDFKFTNTWWLWKRFKTVNSAWWLPYWEENYSNNWIFNFSLPTDDKNSNVTYNINVDSNWFWFWNSFFQIWLRHWPTIFNNIYNTSYITEIRTIWESTFLTRDLEIRWILWQNIKSKWGVLMNKNKVSIIDNKWLQKSELMSWVKKNIENSTKNVKNLAMNNQDYILDFNTPSLVLSNWEKIFYYDFTNKQCNSNPTNSENKWCIVKITSSGKIWITWKNNIIIKGWNLLINTDMYYMNNKSLIWYFIMRDSNNIKNGGNIYITEDPTNILWIAIAEWSLMSVDSVNPTKIYINNNTWPTELNKQLLWYWSIASSNTIWGSLNYMSTTDKKLSCPYWSDTYIKYWWNLDYTKCSFDESNKYDFATLRRFASRAWDASYWCLWNYYWVNWNWDKVDSAFIWKKTCFNDAWDNDLMSIDNHTSSIVIKYDSNIVNNPLSLIVNPK